MKKTFSLLIITLVFIGLTGISHAQTSTVPPTGSTALGSNEKTGTATGATFIKEIYNLHKIPFNWNSQATPFHSATFLTGGYFVLSGTCSPIVTPPVEKASIEKGVSNNKNIRAGLYVFKETGEYIGTRDVCWDGDIPGPTVPSNQPLYCNEGGACEVSVKVIPTGSNSFIREMFISTGFTPMDRPPLEYKVSSTNISLVDKPFKGQFWWDSPENEGSFWVGNLVPVRDGILGIKGTNEENGVSFSQANIFYSDSGFSILREWSEAYNPPTRAVSGNRLAAVEEIAPLAGIGDFVVGTKNAFATGKFDTTVYVFRLKTDETIQEVGTLPGASGNYLAPMYDPSNAKRVGFVTRVSAAEQTSFDLYEVSDSGLKLVKKTPLPELTGVIGAVGIPRAAILGDLFAYATCPSGNASVMPITGNSADPFRGCGVKILKNGTQTAFISLPKWRGFDGKSEPTDDRAESVAMSPKGYIVVGSLYGHLYLYKLGGSTGVPTGPTPLIPTEQPVGPQITNINDYLTLAQAYTQLLQALIGLQNLQGPTSSTQSSTSGTAIQSLFDQALNLIKSY